MYFVLCDGEELKEKASFVRGRRCSNMWVTDAIFHPTIYAHTYVAVSFVWVISTFLVYSQETATLTLRIFSSGRDSPSALRVPMLTNTIGSGRRMKSGVRNHNKTQKCPNRMNISWDVMYILDYIYFVVQLTKALACYHMLFYCPI